MKLILYWPLRLYFFCQFFLSVIDFFKANFGHRVGHNLTRPVLITAHHVSIANNKSQSVDKTHQSWHAILLCYSGQIWIGITIRYSCLCYNFSGGKIGDNCFSTNSTISQIEIRNLEIVCNYLALSFTKQNHVNVNVIKTKTFWSIWIARIPSRHLHVQR